ncbi:MAG TPA: sulfite exporter TauE/SafE family protein [Gaiellaceae bacterium]|nr:sulfite exporter TauE/SafE family protein [Gaiellaceae bacterium]
MDPLCCQLDPKWLSSDPIDAEPAPLPTQRARRLVGLDVRLIAVGAAGGLLSGLLGVGGGIVMVPLLVLRAGYSQKDAHAVSLGAIIPISVAGVATYGVAGKVHPWEAIALAVGSIGGARIGAGALASIDERRLKLVFALFLGAVAILMLVRG